MIFGVDIASWQGNPDFARLKAEGHEFAITKTTGEQNYVNPLWRGNRDRARAADLIVGTYDWVEPQGAASLSGADAARDYLRVIGERQPTDLLCVDFESPEWTSGPLGRDIEPWMREYLYTLRDLAGQPVIVYTARYFLEETGATGWDWLGKDFLYWQAAPGPKAMLPDDAPWPATTPPFAATLIHQHQWHATSAAVVGEFDRNRFQGTRAELAAYGLPGTPPAASTLTTPAISWEGEGTIVASEEWVIVRNDQGQVYQRRRIDGTMGGWIELTSAHE